MNPQIQPARPQQITRLYFLMEETMHLNTLKLKQQEAKKSSADSFMEMQTPTGHVDQADGDWKSLIAELTCAQYMLRFGRMLCHTWWETSHDCMRIPFPGYRGGGKDAKESLDHRVLRVQAWREKSLSCLRLDVQSQELTSQNDRSRNNRDRASLGMCHAQQRSGTFDCSVFCMEAMVGCRGAAECKTL